MLRIRNYFITVAVVFAISSAYAVVGVQDAKAQSTMGDLIKRIEALESKGGGNVTAPKVKGLKISGHIRTRGNMKTQFHAGNSATRSARAADGTYTIAVPNPSTSSSQKHIGVSRNQNYIVQRIRLGFDFDVNKNVLAHAMIDSNRTWGGDQNTIQGAGNDTASMKQAYFKLRNLGDLSPILENVTVLAGRKQWAYGDQRLIGHLNWTNVGRAHDGAIIRWQKNKNWVDIVMSQVGVDATDGPGPGQTIASTDREEFLYGFYSHFQNPFGTEGILAEPYLLVRDRARDRVDTDAGETRYYGGLRIVGKKIPWLPGLDFTAEQVFQWGQDKEADSLSSNDISAFGGGWKVGYRFASAPWTPRIGYEFVYASGDDKPNTSGDGNNQSSNKRFSQLYPLGHAHLGYMDQHGWENIEAHRASINLKPTKKLVLNADLWFFEAAEVEDDWRSVGGGTARVGGNFANSVEGGASKRISVDDEYGQELDLVMKYKLFKNVGVVGGYSHYWQGDFMEDTNHGNAPGADWVWLQCAVKF